MLEGERCKPSMLNGMDRASASPETEVCPQTSAPRDAHLQAVGGDVGSPALGLGRRPQLALQVERPAHQSGASAACDWLTTLERQLLEFNPTYAAQDASPAGVLMASSFSIPRYRPDDITLVSCSCSPRCFPARQSTIETLVWNAATTATPASVRLLSLELLRPTARIYAVFD